MKAFRLPFTIFCLLFLFGCASGRDISNCNQRLSQQENEQRKIDEEIKGITTSLEQINQTVNNLKFDMDLIRKEVLASSERSGVEPVPVEARNEVSKLVEQLRSEKYDPDQIITQATTLGKPAFMALGSLLRDPDFKVRTRAETVLSRMPSQEINQVLYESLKNPELRTSATRILGNLKNPAAVPVLVEYLKEESPSDFPFVLSEALVKLKDKRGLPRLIDYLKSDDAVQRVIAFDCLSKVTVLTFDYKPYAPANTRADAVRLWQEWWLKNGETFQFKKD